MEELQEFSEQEESNFDLKAEIYKYLTHWKWLVFGSLLGLAIAYLYNRYTIPEYRTEATMMIMRDHANSVAGALPSSGGSIFTFDNSSLANQIETLSSKQLVENVIDELNLNITYFIEGNVIAVEAYKSSPVGVQFLSSDSLVHQSSMSLFVTPQSSTTYILTEESSNYSNTHQFGEKVSLQGLDFIIMPRKDKFVDQTVNIKVNSLRQVANNYISRMEISPKGKANDILSLSITGKVPEKAQDFLDTLIKLFNLDGMADKQQVAESTSEFIQERLQIISNELDSVEGGIAEFKRENQLMSVTGSANQYMAKSTMAEQQIFDIQTQLIIIESVEKALNSSEPYKLLPSNVGIESGGISGSINNYNTLVLERNKYLNAATPQNPVVESITGQLNSLRENLLENIQSAKSSLNIQIRELSQLDQRSEGQFSTFPGLEQGIRSKERQRQIKEQLYLFLLQRREEAAISFAATSPVAKVIDPAFTYNSPVGPKPWLILLGGFLIGFLVPLLIIFVKNFLDTKVHHKGDLNPLVKKNIPFLGEIPKVSEGDSEIIQLNDRSPLAESFRILRTNLAYLVQSRNKEKGEVIFVTSTIKAEGKTFVSFNMARTLASTNKKVILVGADIRNPKLHKYTEEPMEAKGLSDYLYDFEVQIPHIIKPTNDQNISVDLIFSGAIPPNPAELFMNDRMELLLDTLKKEYDYIIVDTAPTMIVTDTLLISPLADTTLYIVKAGFTEKKLLDFPKDLKQQGKIKGLALVLNDVDYSKFSYGAKYGYSYGYGYGYGTDKERKFLRNPFKKRKS